MTDTEIIKALELCIDDEHRCGECPYLYIQKDDMPCAKAHGIDLLDLINRLQAEIERLEGETDKQYETAEASIRAEIASGGTSCHWCEKTIRAGAIKDFAERLKEKCGNAPLANRLLDNIVEEMIGAQE
jgi:hypothetical protein